MRQPTEYTPIWLMRQAGRYLTEYKSTRARAGSFLALAKNPTFATEVTLQPLARFPLDAAILFSDILTIPDAMGLGLSFEAGEGPRFSNPLRDEADILKLTTPDLNKLRYVFDAVSEIRKALEGRVPLIGFSGSPWTLACYMVEGAGSTDLRTVKTMVYKRPDLMMHILETNAQAVGAYLNAQIEAGAQTVMVFDTWGGALADGIYQRFSLNYMQKALSNVHREWEGIRIPHIVFTKGGGQWLEDIAQTGPDAIGLDWTINLANARQQVGDRCALQGNFDPTAMLAPPEAIRAEARRLLNAYGNAPGHVFNLGHGISQFTPPENVVALVDEVHSFSRKLRQTL
ncbi:Uroporphyrinogen decarboxylase [Candidatus Pandoraea novymonadis]|uniref:Uroporphyrinogen decarboxylase n=2 Tax=Candidatus Pandoraea novymonadis TaxID=1808959 RepID=A0ABX5FFF8_9BURK|nr:Uroporphyrinogen decarboxylase [Candidatus Pandoraea novymonadis]